MLLYTSIPSLLLFYKFIRNPTLAVFNSLYLVVQVNNVQCVILLFLINLLFSFRSMYEKIISLILKLITYFRIIDLCNLILT